MAHLAVAFEAGVATLTLDNPAQNRIGDRMVEELDAAIDEVGARGARAVLLRADGPDFSFGGDIEPWPDDTPARLRARFERYLAVFNRFERLPVPVVAAVQGLCFGGGLELAVRADVIFAGESARFGHPEQSLGIITLLGGVYRIAERAGRARAAEWALTSEQVPAPVLAAAGVVNRVVPDAELRASATEFARTVAAGPTRAYAAHKVLLRTWAAGGVAAADEVVLDLTDGVFATEDARSAVVPAVRALREGRPRPRFEFHGR
jgi:enoyl-CoA hydratase/carnithine racemase